MTHTNLNIIDKFFDKMGSFMLKSNVEVKKLVMGVNDDYVLEGQHIKTNRKDSINLDQDMCVLWIFSHGKIMEGKHFIVDQCKVDDFFNL